MLSSLEPFTELITSVRRISTVDARKTDHIVHVLFLCRAQLVPDLSRASEWIVNLHGTEPKKNFKAILKHLIVWFQHSFDLFKDS
ncbi:hypothetical protein TNCV_2629241 [Trichonephila clavipes]|uniref:Uncharacterized protein n=1 Tax=Trichonephila clavipes TaxID=2585209 RepID=A0A8X6SFH4_TRICX|nr:hypothetical protein TNCV_2629241 [Trichonephila clavipes]